MLPALLPARMPSAPRNTSRTSRGKPTIANTTSLCWATMLRAARPRRPAIDQRLGLGPRAVIDRHREALAHQVPAHRAPHHAGADPAQARYSGSDFCDCHLCLSCWCALWRRSEEPGTRSQEPIWTWLLATDSWPLAPSPYHRSSGRCKTSPRMIALRMACGERINSAMFADDSVMASIPTSGVLVTESIACFLSWPTLWSNTWCRWASSLSSA